jgi:2-polyprenyl-6-hydroxyphenyl methylase / 3-demethylubiquinone-9 3-methyltransferase
MSVQGRSIDAGEIDRFERIGEDWWNPRGSMRALHRLNPTRVAWIGKIAAAQFDVAAGLRGLRVLDIGCGGGILSESLARLGAKVTAIDPAPGNLDIARAHAATSGLSIDYRAVSAEELAASGATFDIVCAMEVVEHVVDPAAFVGVACSMARPGGLFFAATLNRTLKSFGLAILGAEYILRWAPRGTHQWEKFVTPDELEVAMEDAGAPVVARTGVVYTPVLDAWRLSGDMGVNYMMAGRREG